MTQTHKHMSKGHTLAIFIHLLFANRFFLLSICVCVRACIHMCARVYTYMYVLYVHVSYACVCFVMCALMYVRKCYDMYTHACGVRDLCMSNYWLFTNCISRSIKLYKVMACVQWITDR